MVRENKLRAATCARWWDRRQKLGVSPKGNTIHLMVAAWWGAYLGEGAAPRHPRQDLQLHPPPRQHHDDAGQAVSNYTNSILANMEVTDEGYDEALLLDSAGFV